ncbi:uncharacterized protein [Phyllobates terribilis]|uniref:uncharacterized protein n=1 Tax=Phyllobates terribilis TaxID=111132 RepID=UPI003CCA7E35
MPAKGCLDAERWKRFSQEHSQWIDKHDYGAQVAAWLRTSERHHSFLIPDDDDETDQVVIRSRSHAIQPPTPSREQGPIQAAPSAPSENRLEPSDRSESSVSVEKEKSLSEIFTSPATTHSASTIPYMDESTGQALHSPPPPMMQPFTPSQPQHSPHYTYAQQPILMPQYQTPILMPQQQGYQYSHILYPSLPVSPGTPENPPAYAIGNHFPGIPSGSTDSFSTPTKRKQSPPENDPYQFSPPHSTASTTDSDRSLHLHMTPSPSMTPRETIILKLKVGKDGTWGVEDKERERENLAISSVASEEDGGEENAGTHVQPTAPPRTKRNNSTTL